MVPVLHPNMVRNPSTRVDNVLLLCLRLVILLSRLLPVNTRTDYKFYMLAEFRGPGVHHNFDDNGSPGYENDSDSKSKSFGIGGYKGRIIFLGDGTEVLTDGDDTEMFDNSEEDKDLDSQVSKASSSGTSNDQDDLQVIGSPVTPEKLDPSMELDRKTSGAASSSSTSTGSAAPAKSEETAKTEEKKKEA